MAGETPSYIERFRVGWGDIDGNHHMANRAYLDRAADTRFLFFSTHGFPAARFNKERIGPAIVHDELTYRRELRLGDPFSVDLRVRGLSGDGTRFIVENAFYNAAEELAALVTSEGVWFDLEKRKPRVPPVDLDAVMRSVPKARDFSEIPSRSRQTGEV